MFVYPHIKFRSYKGSKDRFAGLVSNLKKMLLSVLKINSRNDLHSIIYAVNVSTMHFPKDMMKSDLWLLAFIFFPNFLASSKKKKKGHVL